MTNNELLKIAALENGFESVDEMLQSATYDGDCPSICTICGVVGENAEPDAHNYECDACHCKKRSSVLIIAGLM